MDYSPKPGDTYKITEVVCGKLVITEHPWISRDVREVLDPSITLIFIDNNPYFANDSSIGYCDETSQWEIARNIVKGFLGIGKKGTLRYNKFKTVLRIKSSGKTDYIKDEKLALEMGLRPSMNTDGFYDPKDSKSFVASMQMLSTFPIQIRTTHHADERNSCFREINEVYQDHTPEIEDSTKVVAKLLGDLTFGVEFETAAGAVQMSGLGPNGIVPLIDGSLGNRDQYEYTTVVFQGAKGLQTLKSICARLTSQCKVDQTCALHVHLGTLPRNKEFIVTLYQLFYRLQEELFSMVPYYKRHEGAIMGKQREYSERLIDLGFQDNTLYTRKSFKEYTRELDQMYGKLFEFASCGAKRTDTFNSDTVREGNANTPWDRQWHCPTRYYAMNVVNYFFSKSGTVEFRLHGPTLSFQKTSIWLLICVALVNYAKAHHSRVLEGEEKIRLKDVIDALSNNFGQAVTPEERAHFTAIARTINNYIRIRKDTFKKRYSSAVHRTLNGRSNINSEHAKNASLEFSHDHINIKDCNLY